MQPSKIHIFGASGSGTTTLARALSDRWAVPHADADDYFWVPTDPPFSQMRSEQERLALMWDLFVPRGAWVLSGSMCGWGDSVIARCDGLIFLTLDKNQRLDRLRIRESIRLGVQDPRQPESNEFLEWAAKYDDPQFEGRSRAGHEAWLLEIDKPVLRLDSAQPVARLLDAIDEWQPGAPVSS